MIDPVIYAARLYLGMKTLIEFEQPDGMHRYILRHLGVGWGASLKNARSVLSRHEKGELEDGWRDGKWSVSDGILHHDGESEGATKCAITRFAAQGILALATDE